MLKLPSLRLCVIFVMAAYLLMALEWPTTANADDKSSKGTIGEQKWHPKRLPGFDENDTTTKQLIVLGVIAGIVVTAAIVGEIAGHGNKPKNEKKAAQENEKAEKKSDEEAGVRNFYQPASLK